MSNPEKAKKEDFNEQWSDEEVAMREIVLGLPAIRAFEGDEKEEVRLNDQARVAAAKEAVMKEKSEGKKKKRSRSRKTDDEEEGCSGKKGKKKPWKLIKPPKGRTPVCSICGRGFASWEDVYGHLRDHKDRMYKGFLHPLTLSAAAQVLKIPGPNSAFVVFSAGRGESSSDGRRGLGIDLNVDAVVEQEDDQDVTHESEH